ncbi:MAG: hypothetical protein MUC48_24695 [Leptolyngbya sp. Prado105]|jgi:hypothetical protein|nr:hypothetical protein [Leptolyngbya sp. Prado105]
MQLKFKDKDIELEFDGSAEELQFASYELQSLRAVRSFVRSEESVQIQPRSIDVQSLLFDCPSPPSLPESQPEIIEATAQTILPMPVLAPAKRRLPKWVVPTGFSIVFGSCVGFAILFAISQAKRSPIPPPPVQQVQPKTSPKPIQKKLSVPAPPPPPQNPKSSVPPPPKIVCIPLPATQPPKCD